MANTIRIKRGNDGSLPGSFAGSGEPLWSEDLYKLYVATNGSSAKWVGAEIDNTNTLGTSQSKLATQNAIKTYVDTQLTAQDLDFTTDTAGNSQVDLDSQVLTFAGGEGMDVTHSGQAITVAGELATSSNKGVASYSADNFLVSSGVVTVKDGGVANAELVNSSVTVVAGDGLKTGGAVALGASVTIDIDLNEVGSASVDIANDSVAIIDASDNTTKKESLADIIAAIDGTGLTATNGVLAVDATQAVTNISGNLTIAGDLTVQGDNVVTEVATMQIEDGLIQLAKRSTVNSDDIDMGVYGAYSDDSGSSTEYAGIYRDASVGDGVWTFFDGLTAAPGSGTNAVDVAGSGYNYAAIKCADITGVDDDGTGYAELNGFNLDGGSY
jgi:hypothetical protein|tara:strand:- start:218 stop:1369 length:1152 start_codon:yes stop_codon:yes gene_type:complete